MKFSYKGNYLAWSDGKSVHIQDLSKATKVSVPAERTQFIEWSPQDKYLSTWEIFAVRNGKQEPNSRIWDIEGQLKASFVQRKSDGWQPRWSSKEDLVAVRSMNNEVNYYKDANFDSVEKKLSLAKMFRILYLCK